MPAHPFSLLAHEKLTQRRQDAEAVRRTQQSFAPFAPLREASRAIFKTAICAGVLALMGILLLAGCAARSSRPPAPTPSPTPIARGTAVPMPTLTPIPGIRATLTALPQQPPMPAGEARDYLELRAAVERCPAYNENRKTAILRQIDYVVQPASLPSDFLLIYGSEWPGRLIHGSAYLSTLEWKLAGRDRASCLYPIGVAFNALLRQMGQQTFPEYE